MPSDKERHWRREMNKERGELKLNSANYESIKKRVHQTSSKGPIIADKGYKSWCDPTTNWLSITESTTRVRRIPGLAVSPASTLRWRKKSKEYATTKQL